ncbi:hypothetical protein BH09VER1_BH09VER1_31640 [soil metagenome]
MVVFEKSQTRVWTPPGQSVDSSLSRCTHLGIGAHQDDLEFMAFHGIKECYSSPEKWFVGVTCTDGGGSSRTGAYSSYTDEEMKKIRVEEQEAAALVGRFSAMIQLGYPSVEVKGKEKASLATDLVKLLRATRPEVVYTHNPADKHETHLGVLAAVLSAIHQLPREERPQRLLGCEGWRGLDWMLNEDKVLLDVGGHDNLATALNGIFDSQIAGGKRYDLAVMGRRRANATFLDSHSGDDATEVSIAMDLTPLILDEETSVPAFTQRYLDRLVADVATKLARQFGA